MPTDPAPTPAAPALSLRERKRRRTRAALVDAAADLFRRQGYEETTVAQIAAAAEIGTRTFFTYFATKEDVLFPASDERIAATLRGASGRRPGDRPMDALLRSLDDVLAADLDLVSPLAALRLRLIRDVPAVRGRALQLNLDAQRELASRLREAFPDELDDTAAAAVVGAFTGAVTGALTSVLDAPDAADLLPPDPSRPGDPAAAARLRARIRRAVESALTRPAGAAAPAAGPEGDA